MVEEGLTLLRRELNGLDAAHVLGPVEHRAAAELPGDALVDGHVAVLVSTDEVRSRQTPEGGCDEDRNDGQHDEAPEQPARDCAVTLPGRVRGSRLWPRLPGGLARVRDRLEAGEGVFEVLGLAAPVAGD